MFKCAGTSLSLVEEGTKVVAPNQVKVMTLATIA
jgi:hypothetical protein